MTRKLVPYALSALAAAVLALPAAEAQRPGAGERWDRSQAGEAGKRGDGHRGHAHRGAGGGMLLRQLDLTEDQQQAIRALFEQHRAEHQGKREQHMELRRQLRELSQQPDADATEVGRLTLELQAQRQEARASMEAMNEEIQALLTLEQQERYQELREQRRERFEQRREGKPHGKRHGRGPGGGASGSAR